MQNKSASVQKWDKPQAPTREELRSLFQAERLSYYQWSNAPGDLYAAHTHAFHKVIYVLRGSITFGLPGEGRQITLQPGDRLDLPAGTLHDATVGPQGVVCLEGHFD